jgi:hypothetical protein
VGPWRGVHGLRPLVGQAGFLLVGAAAIAVLDDRGELDLRPTPEGYVGLSPTSDPQQFLLASRDDAAQPGGLSESAPFSAYLWTVGSGTKPSLLQRSVVWIAESSIGLAWLRSSDGSWWSVSTAGAVNRASEATVQRSDISPNGRHFVRYLYSFTGCAQTTIDPCSVDLSDETGSSRSFDGPAFGVGFDGDDVGMVLVGREMLSLPWRLVSGPADDPATITIH